MLHECDVWISCQVRLGHSFPGVETYVCVGGIFSCINVVSFLT